MEKKRQFNKKDFLLLFIIFIILKIANLNKTNSKERKIKNAQIAIEDQKVVSIKSTVIFDKNKGSCDLFNVSEKVYFTFQKPTNIIHHLIFSKKYSYYNFNVFEVKNQNSKNIGIENVNIFSNTRLRSQFVDNLFNNKNIYRNFKENWVISIQLSAPVNEIELDFMYNISDALEIDSLIKQNVLHYQYINPYNYPIEKFRFKLDILNYSEINRFSIKSENKGIIKDFYDGKDKGIIIEFEKNLPEMAMYNLNLPLPYHFEFCNKKFYNLIAMILFFITFTLTALGLYTCFKISKE
jgi:hypothetical protein